MSGDDASNDVRIDVAVAVAADVEAGGVPEEIRLRPVLERNLNGDMKANGLCERVSPFERPPFLGRKVGCNIGPVHLEAATGIEPRHEAEIVKQSRHIEQLGIESHPIYCRKGHRPGVASHAVIREKGRRRLAHELLGAASQTRVGYRDIERQVAFFQNPV